MREGSVTARVLSRGGYYARNTLRDAKGMELLKNVLLNCYRFFASFNVFRGLKHHTDCSAWNG
jgi:hypothetical protein